MIVNKYEDNSDWMAARRGKITGTKLLDVTPQKNGNDRAGYYDLIAEMLTREEDLLPNGEKEKPMDRGHRLEGGAIDKLEEDFGKKFCRDLVIWTRDDEERIAISPDGFTEDLTEAAEAKCINSGEHVEAMLTGEAPKKYYYQILQYFIVNDDLQKLHFVMFDPRFIVKQYLRFTFTREQLANDVGIYLEMERSRLERIDKIVAELSNF